MAQPAEFIWDKDHPVIITKRPKPKKSAKNFPA